MFYCFRYILFLHPSIVPLFQILLNAWVTDSHVHLSTFTCKNPSCLQLHALVCGFGRIWHTLLELFVCICECVCESVFSHAVVLDIRMK